MSPRVVPRLGRRREGRVGEGADRDDDQVFFLRLGVEDLGATLGTEVEHVLFQVGLFGDARVIAVATLDLDLILLVARLHPEGASRPALAGEAMTDRDGEGLAFDDEVKLPAVAGCNSGCHRGRNLTDVGSKVEIAP
jgi:hypothetical protein